MSQTTNVTVYSTNWCGFCKQAKKYFDSIDVKYDDINVEEDKAAAEEIIKKTRESLESGDDARIIQARDEIQKASMDLGQKIYQAAQAAGGGTPGAGPGSDTGAQEGSGEKVVDADYTVVDEDKK